MRGYGIVKATLALAFVATLGGCFAGRGEPAGSLMSQSLSVIRPQKDEWRAETLLLAATHMASDGNVRMLEDAVKSGEEAAQIFTASGNGAGVFRARKLQADSYARLGRVAEADRAAALAEAAAKGADCSLCLADLHAWRGRRAFGRGDRSGGNAEFEAAAAILEAGNKPGEAVDVRLSQSDLALRARDLRTAAASAEQAGRLAKLSADDTRVGRAHVQLADVRMATGRRDAATKHLDEAVSAFGRAGASLSRVEALCRRARNARTPAAA